MTYDELYKEWARLSDMERRLHKWYIELVSDAHLMRPQEIAQQLFYRITGKNEQSQVTGRIPGHE